MIKFLKGIKLTIESDSPGGLSDFSLFFRAIP